MLARPLATHLTKSLARTLVFYETSVPFDWDILRDGMTPRRGSVAFTRASTATYIHPTTGLITAVAIDTARIESDGLLIEPQRTNLIRNSQAFDNALWNPTYLTKSAANAATGPDGSASAEILSEKADTNFRFTYDQTLTVTSGATVVISLFVKNGTRRYAQLALSLGEVSGNPRANFDLQTGTLGTVDAGFSDVEIKPFANGWYRICGKVTLSGTACTVLWAFARTASEARLPMYAGNTANNLQFYGAMVEVAATVSSYAPTGAGSAIRSADVCTLTIPAGVLSILITYGDNTTATVSVTPGGTYILPASQKKYKYIVAL